MKWVVRILVWVCIAALAVIGGLMLLIWATDPHKDNHRRH